LFGDDVAGTLHGRFNRWDFFLFADECRGERERPRVIQ
jgi:hypothetical protein